MEDADTLRAIEESTAIAMRAISTIEALKEEKSEQIARSIERAREYEDRTHALLDGFAKERSTLLATIDRTSSEMEAVRDDLDQERASSVSVRRALESRLAEKEVEANALARDMQSQADRIAELSRAKEELERQRQAAADVAAELEALRASHDEEIAALRHELSRKLQKIAEMTDESAERQSLFEALQAELASNRAAWAEELDLSKRELERMKSLNDEAVAEIEMRHERQMNALRSELFVATSAGERQFGALKAEFVAMTEENARLSEAVAADAERADALREEIAALNRTLAGRNVEIERETARRSKAEAEATELARTFSALEARLTGRVREMTDELAASADDLSRAHIGEQLLQRRIQDLGAILGIVFDGPTWRRRERALRWKSRLRRWLKALVGIRENPYFDRAWYVETYPDVRASLVDPHEHYMKSGWREGRQPNALFDPVWYLAEYPDVRHSGIEPLTHYWKHGAKEGRRAHPMCEHLEPVRRSG